MIVLTEISLTSRNIDCLVSGDAVMATPPVRHMPLLTTNKKNDGGVVLVAIAAGMWLNAMRVERCTHAFHMRLFSQPQHVDAAEPPAAGRQAEEDDSAAAPATGEPDMGEGSGSNPTGTCCLA